MLKLLTKDEAEKLACPWTFGNNKNLTWFCISDSCHGWEYGSNVWTDKPGSPAKGFCAAIRGKK